LAGEQHVMRMPARSSALSCVVFLLLAVASPAPAAAITKGDFPPGFVFGTGSSAYQVRIRPGHTAGLLAVRVGDPSSFSSVETFE
jgi:hypothetical protein